MFLISCYLKWFFNKFFGGLKISVFLVSFSCFFNFLILCNFWKNIYFLFPLLLFFSILFLRIFYFNCPFCFCFVCVGKEISAFTCWATVRTKTHATCEWDHLWNDELWIKSTLMPTLVKVAFFKLFILLSIPTWGGYMGCGLSCPCNDQIKEGWESCQFNLG